MSLAMKSLHFDTTRTILGRASQGSRAAVFCNIWVNECGGYVRTYPPRPTLCERRRFPSLPNGEGGVEPRFLPNISQCDLPDRVTYLQFESRVHGLVAE
jgi:hypothetical protein